MKFTHIIGIDEAGRGPIAGPVAVGAVCIPYRGFRKIKGATDSKLLSEKRREELYKEICDCRNAGVLNFCVAMSSASVIDKYGIVHAIKNALERAIKKLQTDPLTTHVLLDGGLKAPSTFEYQKTIIKGDQKEHSISLASIAAKVERDRLMRRLAKKYPEYGFEKHKGYGTKSHYTALSKWDISPEHRISFLSNT